MSKISDKDKALFREAVKGVKPLKESKLIKSDVNINQLKSTLAPPNTITSIKPKLVQNKIFLSNYYTHEVQANTLISFSHAGLPTKRLKELKQGKIPWQSKLDLHGYKAEAAQDVLVNFILQEIELGHRCLLIIHGKGSYKGEPPRLKNLVNHWLQQIPQVLAFHSALPKDGGTGAIYVLLKRQHKLT